MKWLVPCGGNGGARAWPFKDGDGAGEGGEAEGKISEEKKRGGCCIEKTQVVDEQNFWTNSILMSLFCFSFQQWRQLKNSNMRVRNTKLGRNGRGKEHEREG